MGVKELRSKEEITDKIWKNLDLEQRKKVNCFIEDNIKEAWYELAFFGVKTTTESLTEDIAPDIAGRSDVSETIDTEKVENRCMKCNEAFNESPYEHVMQKHFYELFNIKLTDFMSLKAKEITKT